MYSIDYIDRTTWKSVIGDGLVFFASQSSEYLITEENIANATWFLAAWVDVIVQVFCQRIDNYVVCLNKTLIARTGLLLPDIRINVSSDVLK